jgi:hypothetical protein
MPGSLVVPMYPTRRKLRAGVARGTSALEMKAGSGFDTPVLLARPATGSSPSKA